MSNDNFRLVPNGIHPLLLGMDREQVDCVMKEQPEVSALRVPGETALRYEGANARVVLREGRVVEIALTPPANVLFEGRSLFQDPSVWREIIAVDGQPYECLGFIVLKEAGLTLTGFHDDNPSQLAVTAFERGRWDAMHGNMMPLTL